MGKDEQEGEVCGSWAMHVVGTGKELSPTSDMNEFGMTQEFPPGSGLDLFPFSPMEGTAKLLYWRLLAKVESPCFTSTRPRRV